MQILWIEADIGAPIDAVYQALTRPERWPRGLRYRALGSEAMWEPGLEFELHLRRYAARFGLVEYHPPFSWIAEQIAGPYEACVLGLQCHPLRNRPGTRVHLEMGWISRSGKFCSDRWLLRPWMRLWLGRWMRAVERELEARYPSPPSR